MKIVHALALGALVTLSTLAIAEEFHDDAPKAGAPQKGSFVREVAGQEKRRIVLPSNLDQVRKCWEQASSRYQKVEDLDQLAVVNPKSLEIKEGRLVGEIVRIRNGVKGAPRFLALQKFSLPLKKKVTEKDIIPGLYDFEYNLLGAIPEDAKNWPLAYSILMTLRKESSQKFIERDETVLVEATAGDSEELVRQRNEARLRAFEVMQDYAVETLSDVTMGNLSAKGVSPPLVRACGDEIVALRNKRFEIPKEN